MDTNNYLSGLIELRNKVALGDLNWNSVSEYRENNGYTPYTNDSLRRYFGFYDDLQENGWKITPPDENQKFYRETTTVNAKGEKTSDKIIPLTEEEKDNPDALLKAHGYSPTAFELINARSSVWDSNAKDGKILYSSKIAVKPKTQALDFQEISDYFIDVAKNSPIVKADSFSNYEHGAECLVPCFYDVHFGRLAWWGETGENYDYKIARDRFLTGVQYYRQRLANRKFEKILFVLGQDFFNSASNGFTTSGHHEQDNDTRFQKIFEKGVETLIQAVSMFAEMAPVEVILCQGNHSFYEEYYAACVLEAYFRNDERVTVDSMPRTRKYRRFGKTLLGFTHGSEEGDRIFGLMQAEAAEDWSATTEHLWLSGHYHDLALKSKHGVYVWTLPTIVSPDAWTATEGYTTAKKRTIAFVFDQEKGMTDIVFQNI